MNINKIGTTALLALLTVGNAAIAGEEAPRDDYSIGLVWDVTDVIQTKSKPRVNLLMNDSDNIKSGDYNANYESMFPDFER